jgi:hypothetical protein
LIRLVFPSQAKGNGALPIEPSGIFIAVSINLSVKAVLARIIGDWNLARWCTFILLLVLKLSFVAAFLMNLWLVLNFLTTSSKKSSNFKVELVGSIF